MALIAASLVSSATSCWRALNSDDETSPPLLLPLLPDGMPKTPLLVAPADAAISSARSCPLFCPADEEAEDGPATDRPIDGKQPDPPAMTEAPGCKVKNGSWLLLSDKQFKCSAVGTVMGSAKSVAGHI